MDKYNEALEKAKAALANTESAVTAGILRNIFPELKESEDEKIRKVLINGFNKLDKSSVWYNCITNGQILAWLERQGEQKPEWSEEDEDRLDKLVWVLKQKKHHSELGLSTVYSPEFWEETIMWLKSLRPQKQWKPSDEQIMYLSEAIDIVEKAENFSVVSALKELKERLKAL